MNDQELKNFENYLTLRKKAYAFNMCKWRARGVGLAVALVLIFCGGVIYYGGSGLCALTSQLFDVSTTDEEKKQDCDGKTNEGRPLMLSGNSVAVVPSSSQNAIIVKAEPEPFIDRWPLIVMILTKGFLVLTGLGVAALMLRTITGNHNQ